VLLRFTTQNYPILIDLLKVTLPIDLGMLVGCSSFRIDLIVVRS